MVQLNEEQQVAVQHVEGPLLVLAGAGSGKTRVVTHRIARLLEGGVHSSKILALTFTNKAADEMCKRIERLCSHFVSLLTCCTFHSLGARILRESIGGLEGYRNDFFIYDEGDVGQIIKDGLSSLGVKGDKKAVRSIREEISRMKNDLLTKEEFSGSPLFQKVFPYYQKRLKDSNALDFDDLIYLPIQLFREKPEFLKIYQKRWEFISIDEYQDTNRSQHLMVKLLGQNHQNIFAVGDIDQLIYSWRGADVKHVFNFERDFKGARVLSLKQNYRSTSSILKVANALIKHNRQRVSKELWSEIGEGEQVGFYYAQDEREEARFVLEEIVKRRGRDCIPLREFVVFYRTNAQSRAFEDLFFQHRIPYVVVGGLSFYQRREIKDILSLLRVVLSDADFLSFSRTVNLPSRGIGKVTLQKLKLLSSRQEIPILSLCRKIISEEDKENCLRGKQREGIADYLRLIDDLRSMVKEGLSPGKIIKRAIEKMGYLQLLEREEENFEERRENLEALVNKAAEWEEEREGEPSLSFLLEEISLKAGMEETDEEDTVRLMTLHHGKGLEFEVAFIVGMEEDLLPHANARGSESATEEERRLCYVGMTRAKRFLYLTSSLYRLMWGTPQVMRPSRFLKELPRRYIAKL